MKEESNIARSRKNAGVVRKVRIICMQYHFQKVLDNFKLRFCMEMVKNCDERVLKNLNKDVRRLFFAEYSWRGPTWFEGAYVRGYFKKSEFDISPIWLTFRNPQRVKTPRGHRVRVRILTSWSKIKTCLNASYKSQDKESWLTPKS